MKNLEEYDIWREEGKREKGGTEERNGGASWKEEGENIYIDDIVVR